MNISLSSEVKIFAVSFAYGVLCGMIFDIFRALRLKKASGNAIVAVEDVAFWIAVSVMVFSCIYRHNNGQPRWFIFAGILFGATLYRLTVSRMVLKLFKAVLDFVCLVLSTITKIIAYPFRLIRKPLQKLTVPLSKLTKKAKYLLCKIKNDLKKTKKLVKMY